MKNNLKLRIASWVAEDAKIKLGDVTIVPTARFSRGGTNKSHILFFKSGYPISI